MKTKSNNQKINKDLLKKELEAKQEKIDKKVIIKK